MAHGGGKRNSDKCIAGDSKRVLTPSVNTPKKDGVQLLHCTNHMCPIRVHWHVKLNYKDYCFQYKPLLPYVNINDTGKFYGLKLYNDLLMEARPFGNLNYKDYWCAKIAVTNFNYRMNYTQWTLVVQHPNLNNVTKVFSFQYKPLLPYGNINNIGMFYGLKLYNDMLMEASPFGNVESEVLMRKDNKTFPFSQGWAFPPKIYFNSDECKMPPPNSYPYLPNSVAPCSSIITPASTEAPPAESLRRRAKVLLPKFRLETAALHP
uniref:COBRA C-terminal domain-containing protein n=1 Tax=Aegilops tauschii TaxID=37682 RepID=R7W2W5_AEGTA